MKTHEFRKPAGGALLAMLLLAAFSSCSRIPLRVNLPETSPLVSSAKYGVVTEAYLRAKAKPGTQYDDVFYLRRAQIVQIVATERFVADDDPQSGLWYCVKSEGREGWVYSTAIDIHESYGQAVNAVRELDQK
jgi:hypothetical protein